MLTDTVIETENDSVPTAPVKRFAAFSTESRTKRDYDVGSTFNIDLGPEDDANGNPMMDASGKAVKKTLTVTGYQEHTEWVPSIDPTYVFPPLETRIVLLGLESKDRVLMVGPTGVGKTSLVEQIAARLNYNVVKINFDGAITRQDLIGEWVIRGKNMEFQYGLLVRSFQMPGTIIVLDEWDTISGECAFVLQRPLQKDDGKILVMETGGELFPLHPDNTIVATANTCGQGDDTGLYSHGTKVQNYSQLNRFGLTIKMNYMPHAQEVAMLHNRFPDLNDLEAESLVKAVNVLREAYVKGDISSPLSTRDLINWADKFIMMANPMVAAQYCFLNRLPADDALAAEQLLQRIFDET